MRLNKVFVVNSNNTHCSPVISNNGVISTFGLRFTDNCLTNMNTNNDYLIKASKVCMHYI